MRSFNTTNMAEDRTYNRSQSNLNANQEHANRSDSLQQLNEELRHTSGSQSNVGGRTTRIADEMSQDLQYLSRDAPLDGGESTFGAYSTLGTTTPANQTITSSHIYSSSNSNVGQQELDDYERAADFRIEADDQEGGQEMRQEETEEALARTALQLRQQSSEQLEQLAPDNVDIQRPLQQAGFLVSFMVDARGGAMRGCRHSGVRVIIPPGAAPQPMRITCRYLRRERLVHPPPLMEGEACASKIMEIGPAGAKFLTPVLIEVPHFASLRGQEREIIILRSDSGEVWREHLIESDPKLIDEIIKSAEKVENSNNSEQQSNYYSDQENATTRPSSAMDEVLMTTSNVGSGGDSKKQQQQQQQEKRLTRIVTNEFPQYFAIISRIRQQVHTVGPEGSLVDSQTVPRVQAIFTDGALTKRIKIGLQAQSVPSELVLKLFGSLSAITFSPIVTIEPRRRKFHCPIKLKIPLPPSYRADTSNNLRLLCSITGGQSKAIWEDVTGSTPLSIHDKCLLFTTTVSARFWLVHCQRSYRCSDAARFAQELWRHLCQVPFMAKFVIFAKRRDINEANMRVFCMTDDKEEKTLEVQEHYTLIARSRDVEVLDGQFLYLEFGGNLVPNHLSGRGLTTTNSRALINEQLAFSFQAFQENRLAFAVRLRDLGQEPTGRIAFMEDSIKYLASLNAQQRAYLSERRRRAVCTLGLQLPPMCVHYDNILGTPKRNSYYATARIGDLTLADVANELATPRQANAGAESPGAGELELDSLQDNSTINYQQGGATRKPDWMELAPKLGIPRDEVEFIAEHCGLAESQESGRSGVAPALLLLMHWFRLSSPDDRDQDLARGLQSIGRDDIVQKLNFAVEPKRISRSTMELLREIEAIPVRSTENLYANSELSGYAPAASHRNATPSSYSSRGTSLRRLDQNLPSAEDSFEIERRRRTQSALGSHEQEGAKGEGTSTSYEREVISQQTTFVETSTSRPAGGSKTSKRQRRRRG